MQISFRHKRETRSNILKFQVYLEHFTKRLNCSSTYFFTFCINRKIQRGFNAKNVFKIINESCACNKKLVEFCMISSKQIYKIL